MKRIKYIKSEKFFAKEYKDGIIVAFKNIGDNNSSYADQIHQMVSNNYGADLFVSDIIESISVANSHKDSIKDSLFIYVKNGVSISAYGISLYPNKDYIEVKYNSAKILTIQKKQSKRLWSICILVLLCICGYNTIFDDDITSDPNVEIKEGGTDEPPAPIESIIPNNDEKHESEKDDKPIEEIVEVAEKTIVQDEDAVRDCQRIALKAEANEYVRIADKAYNDYADSFKESKGIVALLNYRKALELNKKHGLFFVSERERIEQKVSILEKELK